jgi:hypothetical protein
MGGIGAVVLFALAVISYGYYASEVAPNSATILRVGQRDYSYSYLERRVQDRLPSGPANPDTLASIIFATLQRLQREELVRQDTSRRGITASDEEIDARVRERLGVDADASRESLAFALRGDLLISGLSVSEYREIARAEVLERKLRASFQGAVPTSAEHADLSIIQVQTQETATQAKQRLDSGVAFAQVASELSVNPSRSNGGVLGWVPRGSQSKAVEEYGFSRTGRSDIIEADGTFYIVESRGVETRDVDQAGKEAIVNRLLADSLAKVVEEIGFESKMTNTQVQRMARSIADSRRG